MGGVDSEDQAMCYYSVGCKTMKWWRRVIWRVHDMAITNAVVLHKENTIRTNTNAISQKSIRSLHQLSNCEGLWVDHILLHLIG